jgi:hypothetical protein
MVREQFGRQWLLSFNGNLPDSLNVGCVKGPESRPVDGR